MPNLAAFGEKCHKMEPSSLSKLPTNDFPIRLYLFFIFLEKLWNATSKIRQHGVGRGTFKLYYATSFFDDSQPDRGKCPRVRRRCTASLFIRRPCLPCNVTRRHTGSATGQTRRRNHDNLSTCQRPGRAIEIRRSVLNGVMNRLCDLAPHESRRGCQSSSH